MNDLADPNLDLGLDYTGGINKPTADQVGYFARVDASGKNLEYVPVASVAPTRATFHVDPLSVTTESGSEANPFHSIAAAFAYAAAQLLTAAVIILAPGSNCSGNLALPSTGDWEIQGSAQGLSRATITGNVTASATAQSFYAFSNVNIAGNVDCTTSAAATFFTLRIAGVTGHVNLTATGGGYWFFSGLGSGGWSFFAFGGSVGGALSVAGQVLADNFYFGGTIFFSSVSQLLNCTILNNITIDSSTFNGNVRIAGAATNLAAITISGVGANAAGVLLDQSVTDLALQAGVTFVNCSVKRASSSRSNVSANAGAHALANGAVYGQYEVNATAELLAAGTGGTMGINVVYTDFSGTVVTEALLAPGGAAMGLLVTGSVGSKARGALVFSHKGGAAISFTITGITTAGSFSANTCVTLRRLE